MTGWERWKAAGGRFSMAIADHNFAPEWEGNSVRWGWRAKLIEPIDVALQKIFEGIAERAAKRNELPGRPIGPDDALNWSMTEPPIFYRDAAGRFVSAPFRMSASDIIKEALATMSNRLVVEISPP